MLKFLIRCYHEENGLVLLLLAKRMHAPTAYAMCIQMRLDRPRLGFVTHLEHGRVASCL